MQASGRRGKDVALKIQRRRYAEAALHEISIHRRIVENGGRCAAIVELREGFSHDGHICMAFEKLGASLEDVADCRALAAVRVRRITREVLCALDRLHACGCTHTDLKTGNILYDARSGAARLADFGSVRFRLRQGAILGTREYTPPEVLIGAPLASSLDLWALGCSVFEMLTGRLLFQPRRMAARKYREFSAGRDGIQTPLAPRILKDLAAEKAEQFPAGAVIAGKYKLRRVLGQGRFGTVWLARQLSDEPLPASLPEIGKHARSTKMWDRGLAERDRLWREEKGADDLLDLALNYEHALLIARLRGPFPQTMIENARYRRSYFEEDGEIRFRPRIAPISLRDRLRRGSLLRGPSLELAVDFLKQLLTVEPAARPSAVEALVHPWLHT